MKKKTYHRLRRLFVLLLVLTALPVRGTLAAEPDRLATPENIDLSVVNEHLYLSWDSDSDADYYEITILQTTDLFPTPVAVLQSDRRSIVLDDPLLDLYPGTFLFYVRACTDDLQTSSFWGNLNIIPCSPSMHLSICLQATGLR